MPEVQEQEEVVADLSWSLCLTLFMVFLGCEEGSIDRANLAPADTLWRGHRVLLWREDQIQSGRLLSFITTMSVIPSNTSTSLLLEFVGREPMILDRLVLEVYPEGLSTFVGLPMENGVVAVHLSAASGYSQIEKHISSRRQGEEAERCCCAFWALNREYTGLR